MIAFTSSSRRGLTVVGIIAGLTSGAATAAKPRVATPAPRAVTHRQHHHLSHLIQAQQDLKGAEAAVVANNATRAHQILTAAHQQVELAIQHHRQHHLTVTRSGLSGAITTALHHHHHGHLHQALADIKAAHKQTATGNAPAAVKDIERAGKQVQVAIASHHRLIGK